MGLIKQNSSNFGSRNLQVAIVGKLRRHKVRGYRVWAFSVGSILVALLLFFTTAFSQNAGVSMPGPQIVLRAIPVDAPSKIGPPARFWESKALQKRGAVQSATISVTYTGFDSASQEAFQYAVDIWETMITSPVQIKVKATFKALSAGVLGSAGPALITRDWPGAPVSGTWYPSALANKLYGGDLYTLNDDINASFSNDTSYWYFGTDGTTPLGKYDFVSVVLHELCHGLGFVGSMTVNASKDTGRWGYDGFPYIYDLFTVNGSSEQLIETSLFPNPSTTLATQLQSQNIYFNGSTAAQENGNSNPRLYAPSTWQQGSSYSHLDEATFQVGNVNSLMTPGIASAESIHDPGPISLGIFEDMGWTTSLPVELVLFTANVSASHVLLQWRTETEVNSYGFYIERRAIGQESWNTVGFVNAHGTTSSAHDYSLTDHPLNPGRYAYRLKQVDFGGAYEYFGNVEVEVAAPSFFTLEQNFPNPFNPSTVIQYSLPLKCRVRLEVFNTLGERIAELVNSEQDAGTREVAWTASVPSGAYFYRIVAVNSENHRDGFVQTKKLIVLR